MRFLGIDTETTGLDFKESRITEIGFVVMELGSHKPLDCQTYFVYEPDVKKVPEEITKLTGITYDHLIMYGKEPLAAAWAIGEAVKRYKVDYLVAHNAAFDMTMLKEFSLRHNFKILDNEIPVIDTAADLPEELYAEARTTTLSYLAAHLGFINPFPHAALFDVMTMMKVLFAHDVEKVVERSKIPWVVAAANVQYDDRQLAKDRRYHWENLDGQVYKKKWVKKLKQDRVEKEREEAPFPIAIIN